MLVNPVSIVLFALGASCMILSGCCLMQEIGEVNRKLPDDQQIPYWGMYSDKRAKIRGEYKRLYPHGRVHFARRAFEIAGILFFLLAILAVRFFKR
jgi:hypothetical protein